MNSNYSIPRDTDAEKAVLGAMIKSQDARADVVAKLRAEDFYIKAHQEIFKAITALEAAGKGVDMMTVLAELRARKKDKIAGEAEYLQTLTEAAITPGNAKYYAETVADKAKMRALIAQADMIKDAALRGELPPADILDQAEQRILEVAHKREAVGYSSLSEVLAECIAQAQQGKAEGISTGFKDVDKLLGGFQKTDLIILAARPGVGKTAWALNAATNAALAGKKVMIFSLEMAKTQLGERILSATTNTPLERIHKRMVTAADVKTLTEMQLKLDGLALGIDESSVITPLEMKNKCRRFKQEKGGLDLVVIDYLQLMSMGGYRIETREKEIAAITRAMKIMAKELDCAVVLLSQLSRASEQRTDHMPKLSDLRDSGAIEQDADVVIFLKRDDDEGAGLACTVNIAKHRNGPVGIANLTWIPRYVKFGNMAKEEA